MIKSFLIFISLNCLPLYAQQLLLVVAKDINATSAKMELYDNGLLGAGDIDVLLGAKGLGLGEGLFELTTPTRIAPKMEGDKRSPIGIFSLTHTFGYTPPNATAMPFLHATKELICVDDSNDTNYNKIIHMPIVAPKSYEVMLREDVQYHYGVAVGHNQNAQAQRGSCIFLHIYKNNKSPTSGCTAMSFEKMKMITEWLDLEKKPILIQITPHFKEEILQRYPFLRSSRILE